MRVNQFFISTPTFFLEARQYPFIVRYNFLGAIVAGYHVSKTFDSNFRLRDEIYGKNIRQEIRFLLVICKVWGKLQQET